MGDGLIRTDADLLPENNHTMLAPGYVAELTIRRVDGAVEQQFRKRVFFHNGAQSALDGGQWSQKSKAGTLKSNAHGLARQAERWIDAKIGEL